MAQQLRVVRSATLSALAMERWWGYEGICNTHIRSPLLRHIPQNQGCVWRTEQHGDRMSAAEEIIYTYGELINARYDSGLFAVYQN